MCKCKLKSFIRATPSPAVNVTNLYFSKTSCTICPWHPFQNLFSYSRVRPLAQGVAPKANLDPSSATTKSYITLTPGRLTSRLGCCVHKKHVRLDGLRTLILSDNKLDKIQVSFSWGGVMSFVRPKMF